MGLFVSLYLILLAFFIILNAISNQATDRARATIESVNDTFSAANPAPSPNTVFPDPDGQSKPLDDLLTNLQGQFFAEFEIQGRFSSEGGKALQIRLPIEYLFNRGAFELSDARKSFLKSVIDTLSATPVGSELDVAFMFGSGNMIVSRNVTRSQEVAIRRAGVLARTLRAEGMSEGQFSTGFTQAAEEEVVVIFREKTSGQGSLRLSPRGQTDG